MKRALYGRKFALWKAPVGWLGAVYGDKGLVETICHTDCREISRRIEEKYPDAQQSEVEDFAAVLRQLDEYFRGCRRSFDLALDFRGIPPFTAAVLKTLSRLPYGQTFTYAELAAKAGNPRAARAVGRAMACNPFPIIIPCHRIVGAGGKMTGYSAGEGIRTKLWLLDFERKQAVQPSWPV